MFRNQIHKNTWPGFFLAIGLIGGEKKTQKKSKKTQNKNENNSEGSRVKFLFQQFAHSKLFHLKTFSSPVHVLHKCKSWVQCAFSQACHHPCKLYWINMELGWVQLSKTWRHLTWGLMNFGKAVRNVTAVYTCNSKLESWAVYEPSLHHLQSAWKLKSEGSRIWKKSNLRIVPKTWQWLRWRVVWHEGEKVVLIKPHNRVWKPIYSTASFPEAATATEGKRPDEPWGWARVNSCWRRVCSKEECDPERWFT